MRTHTGEKVSLILIYQNFSIIYKMMFSKQPYICNICDRKYSQASGLRTHRKSHTIRDLPEASQNEMKPSMMMAGNGL